ncbi:hypothetical protein GCM10011579_050490 [Streptomyces albiflavescens]|uniref:Uncharacterized protein n=1 Tax=Streptomyces albiflavescens TaxID=1623582 RepID=A0A917Y8E9_9ACTN|nr:hypothetical protein [Streptomyces albiflavescens]GGN72898.1 hypothetical protein GCM10011579_050490 [Streptomyces albiflavescens]
MSQSAKAPYSAASWLIGWVVFLVSGFVASALLSKAWDDCDIGINASANLGDLVTASTTMAVVSTCVWALMRRATGRRQLLLPFLLTVATGVVLLWPLMAIWHASDGYPVSFCPPDNVPPWWPGWLPV